MNARTHRAVLAACTALTLVTLQLSVIRFSGSEAAVRIVLPVTIAAVPAALWVHRGHVGIWVMLVGFGANLAVILANGGLMPIERSSIVQAVGAERANQYEAGTWISGSKDVLVEGGGGRAVALGDGIVLRVAGRGLVASPGDVVIVSGLAILIAEALVHGRYRRKGTSAATRESRADPHSMKRAA